MSSAPHLVVDLDVLERNIAAMAARGREADVAIRPHVKTHKIPQIADLQREAGARGITVATIGEAETFVASGFDDVLIAYPVWVDAEDGARLRTLADAARVRVGCDSLDAARQVRRHAGTGIEVLIELDSGQHRSGTAPAAAGELADGIAHLGLAVAGVFTFPGHSYTRETRAAAAHERTSLALASQALRAKGVEPRVRSGGSSPSMAFITPPPASDAPDAAVAPTEMRPGAYVFNDAQQWELGVCGAEDIALTAHARVVSHAGGQLVLGAGSKTLAPDKAPWATGHGRLLDLPDARIVQLSEHHAVVDTVGTPLPALGSIVRVVPNHCCNAVNLADTVDVVRAGRVLDTWPVAARGRNG